MYDLSLIIYDTKKASGGKPTAQSTIQCDKENWHARNNSNTILHGAAWSENRSKSRGRGSKEFDLWAESHRRLAVASEFGR